MLPNPFQKPLTEFKDTDPLKNREIVRELLGPEGVHKYRKILGDTSDPHSKRDKGVSKEELLAMAAEARAKIDSLSRDSVGPILERLIEKGYASQIKSLKEIGFLEREPQKKKKGFTFFKSKESKESPSEKIGFTDIIGTFREVPSEEAIKNHFLAIPNIKQKIDQGFTRLLIVPFGSSLDSLREKMGELIKRHKKENKLLAEDGTELELDVAKPIFVWEGYDTEESTESLVYYPELFDSKNHNGKTKRELLSSSKFPGYNILLIQDDTRIPRQKKGTSKSGRAQLEARKSPNDYLELLKSDPSYANEHGLTPEDWFTLFATNLNQKNKVINDWEPNEDSANILVGSYFSESGGIPNARWARDFKQVDLSWQGASATNMEYGILSAVG